MFLMVEALEFIFSLYDYAVYGSKGFSCDGMLKAMQQGKAAMAIFGSPYIMKMQDKNESLVWDKIIILPIPEQIPGTQVSHIVSHGHSIPRDSKIRSLLTCI